MKLSIIIPIYNVQDYLAACLDSAIVPDLPDYEIIAVNDGSTDGSAGVLEDYVRRCPALIRALTTPNGGLGHARNTGIAAARGDYLLFLDSDDTLSPGAVREMLDCLDGSFDVGVFDFVPVDEHGTLLQYDRGCMREGRFRFEDYPSLLLSPPNAVNKLWRRSLFTESGIRFPDRQWFEDLATIPRLYLRAGTIRNLAKPWYRYLRRPGSITNSSSIERNREMLLSVAAVIGDYAACGKAEDYHDELEAMIAYHEALTSSTRVNLLDAQSPVQDALLEDFLGRFPGWRANPYIRAWPKRHRLLLALIVSKRRWTLHALMSLNRMRRQ